jgi:hypothetical protein
MSNLQLVSLVFTVVAVIAAGWIYFRSQGAGSGARRQAPPRPARQAPAAQMSAGELLVLLKKLDAENAQWSRIISAINPSGDREIAALLQDLRGPHMFAPHTALGVMLDGARSVKPQASVHEALATARDSMNRVVRYGN